MYAIFDSSRTWAGDLPLAVPFKASSKLAPDTFEAWNISNEYRSYQSLHSFTGLGKYTAGRDAMKEDRRRSESTRLAEFDVRWTNKRLHKPLMRDWFAYCKNRKVVVGSLPMCAQRPGRHDKDPRRYRLQYTFARFFSPSSAS